MEDDRPELNFSEDAAIDLDNLHIEWANQAQKRKKYADEVAYYEDKLKKIHQREKVCRSRLILEAKDKKLANATLQEAYYRNHEDHQKIKEEKIECEKQLAAAWNALNSINDLKDTLANEVSLWKGNYFATPRELRDVEPGKIKMDDQVRGEKTAESRKAVNRRRRKS